MKTIFTIITLIVLQTFLCKGQDIVNSISFTQNDLTNLRIEQNTYVFGWLNSVFSGVPCMRDYRKDNLKVSLIDSANQKEIPLNDETDTKSLRVITKTISLDTITKKLTIKGFVTDGWFGAGSEVQIFIGLRVDTISPQILASNLDHVVYYNGKKVDEPIIVNSFPAFYLKDFINVKSEVGYNNHKKRAFKIESEINENSILVFGLYPCYAEIFEIGKLLKHQ